MRAVARILARQTIATIRSHTVVLVSMDITANLAIETSTKIVEHHRNVENVADAFVLIALYLDTCKC